LGKPKLDKIHGGGENSLKTLLTQGEFPPLERFPRDFVNPSVFGFLKKRFAVNYPVQSY